MARSVRHLAHLALFALPGLAFASACAGPPIPGPVEGVPVCSDFDLGRARMEGTLHRPVRMRVLDGKQSLFQFIISGVRHADDPMPRTLIVDDNAEYTVEWAQCANERAPRSVAEASHAGGKGKGRDRQADPETGYDCGETTVYKTDKLVTKKGDRASHKITFAAPPDATCWKNDAPPPAPAPTLPASDLDGGADAAPATPAPGDAGAPDASVK